MNQPTQQNLLALVKRNYEEIAGSFSQTRTNRPWPELLKLTEPVNAGDRILDVGCGNGRLAEALTGKKVSYLGLDSSEKLIEIARRNFILSVIPEAAGCRESRGEQQEHVSRFRFGGRNNKGIGVSPSLELASRHDNNKFILGDVLELDKIPEKDFDYVFCVAMLHHLPGQDSRVRALELMRDKLKPDGKIIITVWNLWQQTKFRRLILKFALLKILAKNKMDLGDILFDWKNKTGEEISQRYYHAFTKRELKKIAVMAGLKIEKLYKDRYNYYAILGG